MATYALTVSTNALGLGVISGATVRVEKRRIAIADTYPPINNLIQIAQATNSSGIATFLLQPDDNTVYHEIKIFDLVGILVYSTIFSMPPQAVSLADLPVQDIVSASAAQAVAASVEATAQAVISTNQAVIATTKAGEASTSETNASAGAATATAQAGIATTKASEASASAATATAQAVLTGADRLQTAADVISTTNARDAALIQAGVYTTEPLGRAAVADGQAFKVQGSGDIAAYEYRRVDVNSSTLIATYPSTSRLDQYLPTIYETLDETYAGKNIIVDPNLSVLSAFPDERIETIQDVMLTSDLYETLDATEGKLILLDANNKVIAKLTTQEDITNISALLNDSKGSRASLTERLSAGLTPYGDPIGPYANTWSMRETRMRLQKLALAESAQYVLTVIGDSYTQGNYWTQALTKALQTQYGNAGSGWIGFAWWGTASGTWTAGAQPTGIDGNVRPDLVTICQIIGTWTRTYNISANNTPSLSEITSSTVNDYVRFTVPANHNAATLFYAGNGTGVVQISWDDGASYGANINLSTSGAANIDLTGIPITECIARIKVISGSVSLAGVDLKSSISGVRVNKLGGSGSNTTNWAGVTAETWRSQISKLAANAHIVMFGTNDQGASMSTDTFKNNLSTIFANITNALPATDKLLGMPPENNRTNNAIAMNLYAQAAREYAVSNDAVFIDTQYFFGSAANNGAAYAFANANRAWYGSDLVHPQQSTGGRAIASAFLRLINSY